MALRHLLLRGYWRLESTIAPGLRYSQFVYEEVLRRHVQNSTAWLDLGCGRHILPSWRGEAERALVANCERLVGVDPDYDALAGNRSIALKCQASASQLPFLDGAFDLVTANMVVEHLDDPQTQFGEIARVLKPGGFFLVHTPNAVGYRALLARLIPSRLRKRLAHHLERRREDDVYPTFYRANSRAALEALARKNSFRVRDLRFIVTTAVFAAVLPIAFLELIWLRVLMYERLKHLRTNIIAVLERLQDDCGASHQ